MWDALHVGMSLTVIGFATMAIIATMFALAMMIHTRSLKSGQFTQTGDTSLSPRSVNWLAAAAIAGAIWICFGLR